MRHVKNRLLPDLLKMVSTSSVGSRLDYCNKKHRNQILVNNNIIIGQIQAEIRSHVDHDMTFSIKVTTKGYANHANVI